VLAGELAGSRIVVADLKERDEIERVAEEAAAVDILVSNAGLPASGPLTDFSLDEIDNALRVNLRAGIMLARLLLPAMLERRSGQLVFMASMAAHVPGPKTSLYNATKFGLRGFAQALRMELHGSGVGVSLVSPTYVSEAGMWAETGQKANSMAGEVTPAAVATAVLRAIRENRREIQVAPAGAVAAWERSSPGSWSA
jgi:short-subunit dehydrogenase